MEEDGELSGGGSRAGRRATCGTRWRARGSVLPARTRPGTQIEKGHQPILSEVVSCRCMSKAARPAPSNPVGKLCSPLLLVLVIFSFSVCFVRCRGMSNAAKSAPSGPVGSFSSRFVGLRAVLGVRRWQLLLHSVGFLLGGWCEGCFCCRDGRDVAAAVTAATSRTSQLQEQASRQEVAVLTRFKQTEIKIKYEILIIFRKSFWIFENS